MSAQAGIVYFDKRPIPTKVADTLGSSLRPYGPDSLECVEPSPGVALFYAALRITPEDQHDRHPVKLASGAWMTWDGRLDNRDDLMLALGMAPSEETPDVLVAAAAYDRWQQDSLVRLTGDWSFALFDPTSRTVMLASDFMGVRPLYYVATDQYCAWSTALETLVELTDRRTDLDDDFLQCAILNARIPGRTAYREISALIAGHYVRLNEGVGPTVHQFWRLPENRLVYGDPRDYESHLRDVFARSVKDRLRSTTPIWMELSGGWDSSSIVCMAARLAPQQDLTTLSYVLPNDQEADESKFIQAVEDHVRLPSVRIPLDREQPHTFPNMAHLRHLAPGVLSSYARMRSVGARVLLSGRMGDAPMGNFQLDVSEISSALREMQLLTAVRRLRSAGLASQRTAWSLLRDAGYELLPESMTLSAMVRIRIRALARYAKDAETVSIACPVSDHALSLLRSAMSMHLRWCRSQLTPWRSLSFLRGLSGPALNQGMSSPPEAYELLLTYPFADQRVIEYVGSVPWSVVYSPGRQRALMRTAFAHLVPEQIARRFSKGYALPYLSRLARWSASELERYDSLFVVQRGYVDNDRLRRLLSTSEGGTPVSPVSLLQINQVESWLRATLS